MRNTLKYLITVAVCALFAGSTAVQSVSDFRGPSQSVVLADDDDAQIFLSEIPAGYREWRFISVAHEEGNLNSFASILGNDIAVRAYREGKLPFPDGAIIAALHYRFVQSAENNKAFGRDQSFVAGAPTNVQFMVKDSKKYATTGGWGFGHFNSDGKPVDDAFMKTCFPCHQKIQERDLVFTRYAP